MDHKDIDQKLFRNLTFTRESVNAEARTVSLAFSSEVPYERYFGMEILDHSPNSIRLGRLNDGGPLLLNHDTDEQVGVVESVEIGSDRVGRAVVRFGKGECADEIFQDVVDGIRRKVSVGYMVHKMILEGKSGEVDSYRVTDWEPFEISIVSVPADNTVGVGRSAEIEKPTIEKKEIEMDPKTEDKTIEKVDVRAIESSARDAERKRVADMLELGKVHEKFGAQEMARQFIAEGKSVADLQSAILERAGAYKPMPSSEIGMTEKEVRSFSVVRLLHAAANPHDAAAQKAAGSEIEASNAARQLAGKEHKGNFTIPSDVLTRDLVVGTPTAGGNLVQTDLLSGSFIDLLRNRLALTQVGATILSGLVGNVAIPKQTGAATAYWVGENAAATESQQTVGQVTMSPKTVGAFTDYGRRLLLQSSTDVENFVRNDLALQLALAIDLAGIHGTGASNQPTGLLATAGIGSVAGGTNGANVTWQNLVDLESAVAIANADVGNMGYLTNAKQRGRMKSILKTSPSTSFLWDGGETPVNGYKCGISNQVSSTLTKGTSNGVCSAIVFGNFADLMIGLWGGLDINVDTSTGSAAGTVRVVALQDVDVGVRNAVSFAAMLDAL